MKEKLARFGVTMPVQLLKAFDIMLAKTGSANRSQTIGRMVRNHLASSAWQEGNGTVCGSIVLLYNHHSGDVLSELTKLQHDFGNVILCTTHVHISHELCLECLSVKGAAGSLKELENAISLLKGIKSVHSAITVIE